MLKKQKNKKEKKMPIQQAKEEKYVEKTKKQKCIMDIDDCYEHHRDRL